MAWWVFWVGFECFFFQAEDGIRYLVRSRGLGDVYKRQPRDTLRDAGVCLDDTYPSPIIDHSEARDRALAAYERIK